MISTHILDTSLGIPAKNVTVILEKKENESWIIIANDHTNTDGRIVFNNPNVSGVYRLNFEIENYYRATGQETFFETIPVIFKIENTDRKYHVPLLLNPFGYSTYRGS